MAIKVQAIKLNSDTKKAEVSLFADTKGEVMDNVEVDIPEGYEIDMGSTVLTAAGDVGFRKSNNTWSWT